MVNDTENLQQETQVTTEQVEQSTPEINLNQAQSVDEVTQKEAQQQPEQPKEEGFQARNFRELKKIALKEREEKERIARELEEIKRRYAPMPEAQEQKAMREAPDYEDINLGDDDVAEGKHLQKLSKNQRKALEKQRQLEEELESIRTERKLEREIPDFFQVVTDENVKAFALLDPMMAKVIGSHQNLEERAKAVYKAIVSSGVNRMNEYDAQKELVKQNMSKPRPVVEVAQNGGTSAMSRSLENYSGELTDEMKKMYYQEMKRAQMRQ